MTTTPPKPEKMTGEIRNRPPTGTDGDRMLAQATGKTEDGKRVSKKDDSQYAAT
jgi:hypothetical protein